MKMKYQLKIPEKGLNSLKHLAGMDEKQRNMFLEILGDVKTPGEIPSLKMKMIKALHTDEERLNEILAPLIYLSMFKYEMNLDVEGVIKELSEALASKTSDQELEMIVNLVRQVLRLEGAIEIIAKARILFQDHENMFLNAKIITDIRPVFPTSKDKEDVSQYFIYHNMQVHSLNDELRPVFTTFVLYKEDLIKLRESIDRALMKEEKVAAHLHRLGATILTTDDCDW